MRVSRRFARQPRRRRLLAACAAAVGVAAVVAGAVTYQGTGSTGTGVLQDRSLTPGDVLTADAAVICVSGYTSTVRNVPQSEKDQAFAEYGITSHQPGQYEVDHLIPLELGGSNDLKNIWPQPADPRPGFHEKDKLENFLHAQVCSGAMSVQAAQGCIVMDWIACWKAQGRP